jgi:hypothetical protein
VSIGDLDWTADIVVAIRPLVEGQREIVLYLDLSVVNVWVADLEFRFRVVRP